jgi:hypothetical protein
LKKTNKRKEEMKSKNYEMLYRLILKGDSVVALVDYRFPDDDRNELPYRDPCRVSRLGNFRISISCRGTEYGGVYPWDDLKGSEIDIFIKECQRLNLEWFE